MQRARWRIFRDKKCTRNFYRRPFEARAAYREISLLLRRAPGRESVSWGDVCVSSLALAWNCTKGSTTTRRRVRWPPPPTHSLPCLDASGRRFAYLPTTYFDYGRAYLIGKLTLFNGGIRPGSRRYFVTRRAQRAKSAMRQCRTLRVDLAQFKSLRRSLQSAR